MNSYFMIRNEAATAPKPAGAVSAVFPGSPTVTHWSGSALAIEPNGRQAKAASQREKAFKERQLLLQRQLRDNLSSITNVLKFNTNIIEKVSNKIKTVININDSFNESNAEVPDFESIAELKNIDDDELNSTADHEIGRLMENEKLFDALNKMRCLYINMLSNYNFIHKTRYIVDYLKIFRNKSIGFKNKPKEFDSKKYIKDNVDDIINEIKNELN